MPRKNEPFLGLGYGWNDGENGWGPGYNEAVKVLALLTVSGIETIQNSPPTPTVGGKAYIVDTVPTGAWAGKAGNIAYWDVDTSVWLFVTPKAGFEVLVKSRGDNGEWYFYSSAGAWVRSPIISEAIEAHRKESNAHGIGNITNLQGELDKKLNKTDVPVPFENTPFPDVWIPLSDSLRMIAGFGRDVMIEKDVVATYANCERATTATMINKSNLLQSSAINEPRFERQGLLREVQSTNLWTSQSSSLNVVNAPLESVILPTGVTGNAYRVTPSQDDFSYVRHFFTQKTGKSTMSCFAKRADGSNEMPTIYGGHSGDLSAKASGNYLGVGWWRMHIAMTDVSGNAGFGFTPTSSHTIPVHICFFQLEDLTFASSYIQTDGSAVTRAADRVTIPRLNNDCVEWYSGADKITPKVSDDIIEFLPPAGKQHIRNLKGFFTPLTEAQKKGLK